MPSLGAARESIEEFLKTLKPALIATQATVPPSPSLALLRDAGVPVVDDKLFAEATGGLAERRRMLRALVINEGWTWEAVWPKTEGIPNRSRCLPSVTVKGMHFHHQDAEITEKTEQPRTERRSSPTHGQFEDLCSISFIACLLCAVRVSVVSRPNSRMGRAATPAGQPSVYCISRSTADCST